MVRILSGRMRLAAVVSAGMLCTGLLAACGGGGGNEGSDSGPIKIGVFGGLNSPAGDSIVNGAKMAADEINEAGGIQGRQVKLVVRDTQLDPQKSVAAYTRLGQADDVVAAVGIWSSGNTLAIMDHMARVKVPFLNTGSASTGIADLVTKDYEKYKYWFRFMHTSAEIPLPIMSFVAEYLGPKFGVKRIALFSENADWTVEVRKIMREYIKAHPPLQLVADETFDVQTKDFAPVFQRLMKAKPDQIIDVSAHVDSAGYTKQWAALKPAPMGGVAVSAAASNFFTSTGGAAAGVWTQNYGFPTADITDKTAKYYEDYLKRFDIGSNYTGTYTYEAMYALRAALERLPKGQIGDSDALVKSLEKTDYTGVLGRWAFEKNHNSKYDGYRDKSVLLVQWKADGTRDVIWPESVATGEFQTPAWWKGWSAK